MNRYPGIRPFRTDERHLFFGRTDDSERLYRLLRMEQAVILYGKSGYGKSSLLRAGIYPRLVEEGRYSFWEIRFGPYKPGESNALVNNVCNIIAPAKSSVWWALKSRQTAEKKRFILFFDQFEELFTYPPDQIAIFKQQLAEALYAPLPESARNALRNPTPDSSPEGIGGVERSGENISEEVEAVTASPLHPGEESGVGLTDETLFYEPFELKILFSIRADRMSLLNQLKDYFPDLLRYTYQLDALDEKQAAEAVTRPAALPQMGFGIEDLGLGHSALPNPQSPIPNPQFSTPPFRFAPEALALIFKELRDPETGRIETSALQIVCKHVEDNIAAPQSLIPTRQSLITITPAALSDLKTVFRAFYDNTIAGLTEAERGPARRLVEDRLIKDGIRLPFAEQALLTEPGITTALLEKLERASLLRVELDEQRRKIYEIGHDTLVKPIEEAAFKRREIEEKKRLQQEADEQRREKEKAIAARRRARLVAAGAVLLSLFAISASYFAYLKSVEANQAATLVLQKEKQVESARQTAVQKTAEAETYLETARVKEEIARQALIDVENEKSATAEQRRLAADNFRQAQQSRIEAEKATENVLRRILNEANRDILKLDYSAAFAKMADAARLGPLKPDIARVLLEIAYFHEESRRFDHARPPLELAVNLLGLPEGISLKEVLNIPSFAELGETFRMRYYPVMISLPGGVFLMGRDTIRDPGGAADELPRHPVRLSAFQLAQTETTFWQYGLYGAATGLKIQNSSPNWGIEGNNPAVNVTWFDACLYLNWLSAHFGLQPVYIIDSVGKKNQKTWEVTRRENANGFCLPTEAEWDYAARGGPNASRTDAYSMTKYAGSDTLDLVGWYWENSSVNGVKHTHPVALKMKNAAGFYDMSGNVWEWCWDWYGEKYYGNFQNSIAENPIGPESGTKRMLRGASWGVNESSCRLTNRYKTGEDPAVTFVDFGFRAARH